MNSTMGISEELVEEPEKWELDVTKMKLALNEFIWTNAHPQMTLAEAENLACDMLALFLKRQPYGGTP